MKNYWLITDAGPAEVEAKTGLRGVPAPGGTLVEAREPVDVDRLMEQLGRVLHPRLCHCAVIHMPPCPFAYVTT